ncbi:hypothetical protein BH11MYX2_BH11MYX2_09290 [soil metagenome]
MKHAHLALIAALLAGHAGAASADDQPEKKAEPVDLDAASGTRADKGTFGIGLILGEPTGISAKLYLADDKAIDAAVGFAFFGGGLQAHTDYLWHPYILQSREQFVLPVYIGPGIRAIDYRDGENGDRFALGVRVVGGILFDFKQVPLDAFVEVAGVVEYKFGDGGGAGIKLNAGAGARYYF